MGRVATRGLPGAPGEEHTGRRMTDPHLRDAPGLVDDARPRGAEALDFTVKRALIQRVAKSPRLRGLLARKRERIRGRRVLPAFAALTALDAYAQRLTGSSPASATVTERRRLLALGSWAVDPEPPPGVVGEDRVIASTERHPVSFRLYTPSSVATGASPGLVFFHGGGWCVGSVATHDVFCRRLALGAACRVASVRYRLAPEHPHPAGLDDARRGFATLRHHAHELGIDPHRLGIGGDSAGGHLAAVVANELRGHADAPSVQLLIYPALDLTRRFASHRDFASGYLLTAAQIDWYLEHFLPADTPRDRPDVSPFCAPALDGVCEALVYTAGFDPLCDEGDAYAERLQKSGVRVRSRCFEGHIHGFVNMAGVITEAREAVETITADLRASLHRT